MRRTGQSVCGHPHAAAVFSKRSRNASGSSCGPIFCTGMWVGGGRGCWTLTGPNLPVYPAPEQLAVLPLVLDEGTKSSLLVCPHVHQRFLGGVLGGVPRAIGWPPQTAIPLVRTWWQRRSGFLPRVSATSVTKFVGRKEADRVGSWRLRCFY